MKIIQVASKYYPNLGGVETHVKEISERLVDRDHDVTVITADAGSEVSQCTRIKGVKVKRCRGFSPNDAFHIAPEIGTQVYSADADIIHAHNYHSLSLLFAAATAGETPLVTTPHYHAGSASPFRDRLLELYHPVGRWAVRRAAAVIAVSEWEAAKIASDFQVTAEVIPNGIQIDRFRDAEPARRPNSYVLTVGRLEEYKGVQYAIDALAHLPDYDLIVAGDGPYAKELARRAEELNLQNRVYLEGRVSDERLSSLYAGAEVYLTLSEFEAYGLTVGEALAAGTPCVVRERGALVDWTRRPDCLGVQGTDPASIASAVRAVRDRKAPHPDHPLLDWDDVTDRLLEVYESVWN
jgi:glycosyltransferase involved in cell wall biosynthesis